MEDTGQARGARVYRYPRWNYMGCNVTVVLALLFTAVWSTALRVSHATWGSSMSLPVVIVFFSLLFFGQVSRFRFYRRQPFEFVVRDGELEVHWRGREKRFDLGAISVGELESTPPAWYKGAKVTTPDGTFYVMEQLKGFDELMALLRREGGKDIGQADGGTESSPSSF